VKATLLDQPDCAFRARCETPKFEKMISGARFSFLLVLAAVAGALNVDKERPVAKVIKVLKEMHDTLEKEADEDQNIYDKMACWCETNEKAKTKAITDGTQRDRDLTAKVPQLAAKGAQLKVEIEQLTKEIKQNEEGLAEATELRAKELGEFRTEEKDGIGSITGLRNAVSALSKPNAALNQQVMLQVQGSISGLARITGAIRHLPAAQRHKIEVLLQSESRGPMKTAAEPQSGEIFGILKGMKESFEANLANAQTEEKEAVATFAEVKATKTKQISTAKEQVDNKKAELADTDEKREQSKEDLEDTRKTVTADQAFLLDLQQRCGSMDKQFADRIKMRNEELEGVSEAMKILMDDDAKDLLNKSTRFVQMSSKRTSASHRSSSRELAARILRNAGSPELSLLASTLKDDVFAKIKESIDKMTAQLNVEQADDVAQRNECIELLNTNEKNLAAKFSEKGDLETKIEDLNLLLERGADEVAAAKAEIVDTKKAMLTASENREQANHDFQTTVTEQRATQELLAKALKKLADVYAAAAFAQVKATVAQHAGAGQAPPQGFGEYKKAGGANGVMGMIENIVEESKQVEAEAVAAETEAQQSYESFIKDSNTSVDALMRANADRAEAMAGADGEKIRAEADLEKTNGDIDGLNTFKDQTHSSCDFLLKNFEVRQSSRTQEIEALAQAKAIMSGAEE